MRYFFFILTIVSCTGAFWQNAPVYHELRPGDPVPEYRFQDLMNSEHAYLDFSDLKGKLLILDFWSTRCLSCIQSWPKLMELQDMFPDELKILLVNPWEERSKINSLIERRKAVGNLEMTLPIALGDNHILEMFPVSGVPHVVWINPDGKVKAITFGEAINQKNIQDLINGREVTLTPKIGNNELITPDFKKALFIDGNGPKNPAVLWQSILTKADVKMWPAVAISAGELGYYIISSKSAVKDLYRLAYSSRYDHHDWLIPLTLSRVIFEVDDETKYIDRVNGEIQFQNFFTYQLISAKPTTRLELQEMMRQDLDRYIGLDARWEKRRLECLVLYATDTSLLNYKTGEKRTALDPFRIDLNKVNLSYFIDNLESSTSYYRSPYPILDKTGYTGLIGNLMIEANIEDYKILDKELQKYGLRFTLEEREIEVLVIREPKGYHFPYDPE